MATILNKIVQSSTPPRNKTDLWLDNGTLRFYKEGVWIPISSKDVGIIVTLTRHDKFENLVKLNYSKDQLMTLHQEGIPLFIKSTDKNLYLLEFGKEEYSDDRIYDVIRWTSHIDDNPMRTIIYRVTLLGDDNADVFLPLIKEEVDVQESLVSGVNIKTINGDSILGEGDLFVKAKVVVDSELDIKSDNPISNKAITAEINKIKESIKWNNINNE